MWSTTSHPFPRTQSSDPRPPYLESVSEPTGVDQLAASPGWQPLPLDRPQDVSGAEGVERAIRSVLERANDWEFSRIAMPVLGGDASQLGVAAAAQTVLDTVLAGRTAPCPTEVCIVVDSEEDESVVDALLRSGKSP